MASLPADSEPSAGPHTELYALLHVSQEADDEEIKRAYRQLAMVYHPDKYQTRQMQDIATLHFQRIRAAFDILIDPQQRQVYDIYGMEGLSSGLELGPRLKTREEIREEYERAATRREELKRQSRTQPAGTVMMSITAAEFLKTWSLQSLPSVVAMQMGSQVQSVLSEKDLLVLGGQMLSRRQMGGGTTTAIWRRTVTDRATVDVTAVAGLRSLLSVSTSRQLSPRVTASMGVSYNWAQAELALHNSWTRQLTSATSAGIQLSLGSESSIVTNWHCQLEKGSLSADLKAGESFIGLSGSAMRRFSDHSQGRVAAKLGLGGAELELGMSRKVSQHSTLGFSTLLGLQGVAWKLRINRGGFKFVFPIILASSLQPTIALGAVALPALILWAIRALLVEKWAKTRQRRKEMQKRRENADKVAESRASALQSQSLLRAPAERKRRAQEEAGGLVVIRALYGHRPSQQAEAAGAEGDLPPPVVDVTVPVQFFVDEGERGGRTHASLLLHAGIRKRGLMGFHDPCPGEEKRLLVEYTFQGLPHEVEVGDMEELRLPQDAHRTT